MDIGRQAGPAAFLEAARALLGAPAVLTGTAISDEWRKATIPQGAQPLGVLTITNADIMPTLLALAAAHKTPVHPISRGRNWGFGSRLPAQEAVVLDLSGLDRVLAIDMDHGTARIEPGVTFAALQEVLVQRGLAWHLPSFGGPPDASVLANALERGEGSGRMGDRFGALWDLDVALTTGSGSAPAMRVMAPRISPRSIPAPPGR